MENTCVICKRSERQFNEHFPRFACTDPSPTTEWPPDPAQTINLKYVLICGHCRKMVADSYRRTFPDVYMHPRDEEIIRLRGVIKEICRILSKSLFGPSKDHRKMVWDAFRACQLETGDG